LIKDREEIIGEDYLGRKRGSHQSRREEEREGGLAVKTIVRQDLCGDGWDQLELKCKSKTPSCEAWTNPGEVDVAVPDEVAYVM
jgi:hypothetical protein